MNSFIQFVSRYSYLLKLKIERRKPTLTKFLANKAVLATNYPAFFRPISICNKKSLYYFNNPLIND